MSRNFQDLIMSLTSSLASNNIDSAEIPKDISLLTHDDPLVSQMMPRSRHAVSDSLNAFLRNTRAGVLETSPNRPATRQYLLERVLESVSDVSPSYIMNLSKRAAIVKGIAARLSNTGRRKCEQIEKEMEAGAGRKLTVLGKHQVSSKHLHGQASR